MASWRDTRQDMIDRVLKEAEKIRSSGPEKDSRFWALKYDKAVGTSTAIIRFLPPKGGCTDAWVRYLVHNVQLDENNTNKRVFYNEKCPRVLDKPCPACEYQSSHPGFKAKATWKYVSNIYVVSDASHPENNGKVFLFEYGKQVMEMVISAMCPNNDGILDEEDYKPVVIPYDFIDGANLQLTLSKGAGGRPDYSKSTWLQKRPLSKNEEVLDEIYEKLYDLTEFTTESNYKDYDMLLSAWKRYLNGANEVSRLMSSDDEDEVVVKKPVKVTKKPVQVVVDDDDDDEVVEVVKPTKKPVQVVVDDDDDDEVVEVVKKPQQKPKKPTPVPVDDDDDDDSIEHIKKQMAKLLNNDDDE